MAPTERSSDDVEMDQVVDLRVRKPVGAILSVRVTRDLATSADEFAREHALTLSELVRVALEDYMAFPPPRIRSTLYGSTSEAASLVVNSPIAGMPQGTRGRAQTAMYMAPVAEA